MNTGVLETFYPPSRGSFKTEARSFLDSIINILVENGAPLLVNFHPYLSYSAANTRNINLDHTLFSANEVKVQDGRLGYLNLFDSMVDAVYSAEEAGGGSLEIVVSETGWPSAGGIGATLDNARIYNTNLIQDVKAGGTPKRPGKVIEACVFAVFDEKQQIPGIGETLGFVSSR